MDGWMDGWMNGWMDGWMDGWMNGWMDGECLMFRGRSNELLSELLLGEKELAGEGLKKG